MSLTVASSYLTLMDTVVVVTLELTPPKTKPLLTMAASTWLVEQQTEDHIKRKLGDSVLTLDGTTLRETPFEGESVQRYVKRLKTEKALIDVPYRNITERFAVNLETWNHRTNTDLF